MNGSFSSETSQTALSSNSRNPRHSVLGFSLVEMLVVVTIIGILASLITAAAVAARRRAKIAAIMTEISQLDMACKAYKERFGEYPPDGIDFDTTHRHLRKAFPRWNETAYPLSAYVPWLCYSDNVNALRALGFFLGGMFDSSGKLIGFSANPLNPFETNSTNRIGPFYEFDPLRLGLAAGTAAPSTYPGYTLASTVGDKYRYWHQGASYATNSTSGAMVYFRAENGTYYPTGVGTSSTAPKALSTVYPAIDARIGTAYPYAWINPQSFQIICSGLNCAYSAPIAGKAIYFPTGSNYGVNSFDDITNFSNGTLEDAMP